MSLQSVEVLRTGQTSFNGAVFDASKQKPKVVKQSQSTNLSQKKYSQQYTSSQQNKDFLRDVEAQSSGSNYNRIHDGKTSKSSNVVLYKQK